MRVLICGDRDWDHPGVIDCLLSGLLLKYGDDLKVIEGCARGADNMAHVWHGAIGDLHEHYPAHWKKYGNAAGPIRNREMLAAAPDLVLAFHDDLENSKGTKDMVAIATEAGIPTYHIRKVNKET